MKREAVLHIPLTEYAHAVDEETIVIRLRAAKGDLVSCTLHHGDRASWKNPVEFIAEKMTLAYSDCLFDWWEVEYKTPYRRILYYFTLNDGKEELFYTTDSFYTALAPERSEYYQIPYVHRANIAKVPDWVNDAVVYNIFPDSFATSKRYISNKPTERLWNGEESHGKRGGTIRGVTENVDYLVELGVNCIYLNPFFAAGAYHKYDTIDYYHVDPCFGTDADFKEMVEVLHKNGVRVIIDGVFNHCGWRFFAFDDVVKNGEQSRYAKWFYRMEFPVVRAERGEIPGYECFAYERLMPKMNTAEPEVRAYFCDVCKYWLREFKVDGWRLDVADEVDDGFWRAFKQSALEANPDAFLIGEIWPTARHWLDGSMFDSAMNYDLRRFSREFFAKDRMDAVAFSSCVTQMIARYRKSIAYAQLNLLDSHDVSRFMSLCGGDKRRLKLAVIFQMCFIGVPSIYYGDEQGLGGVTEDEYRQPMIWDGDQELFKFYQWAISLRKENLAISRGGYEMLKAEGRLYVFRRTHGTGNVTVMLNVGDNPTQYDGQTIEAFGYKVVTA